MALFYVNNTFSLYVCLRSFLLPVVFLDLDRVKNVICKWSYDCGGVGVVFFYSSNDEQKLSFQLDSPAEMKDVSCDLPLRSNTKPEYRNRIFSDFFLQSSFDIYIYFLIFTNKIYLKDIFN